jgi:hypothetical protein
MHAAPGNDAACVHSLTVADVAVVGGVKPATMEHVMLPVRVTTPHMVPTFLALSGGNAAGQRSEQTNDCES